MAHSGAPSTPIVISEFNAAWLNREDIEDSAFMGPWLANTVRACDGLVSMMSYWTFSDVFEEQGVVRTPFYGGFVLIAERGIPKPAFRAFELLHRLGDRRIESAAADALITKRSDGTVVAALWNYAEPGATGDEKTIHLRMKAAEANTPSVWWRLEKYRPATNGSAWANRIRPRRTKSPASSPLRNQRRPPFTEFPNPSGWNRMPWRWWN